MNAVSKDKWIYSENEELYWELSDEFDSKEDAIESAKEDEEIEGESIFVGKKVPGRVCGVDIDYILENVLLHSTDGLEDGIGEDFLMNVEKEHIDELEDKFNEIFFEWIKKYNYEPDWFEVIDVESVDLSNKQ